MWFECFSFVVSELHYSRLKTLYIKERMFFLSFVVTLNVSLLNKNIRKQKSFSYFDGKQQQQLLDLVNLFYYFFTNFQEPNV